MKVVNLLYIKSFIILCLIMGCTNDSEDLNVFESSSLPAEGESYNNMVFLNESEGYLFGEKHGEATWKENGEAFRSDTAVVYSTSDGGKTWKGDSLGEGTIINANQSGKDIYTIRYQSSEKRDTSIICRLNKSVNRWEVVTKIDSYVRDADLSNPNDWVITKKESNGEFIIYVSKDRGSIWNMLLNNPVFQPVIDSGSITFLDSDKTNSGIYNTLLIFDRGNSKVMKEILPVSFEASLLRKYGKILFVAGVEGESLSIYKREKSKVYSLIHTFNLGGKTFPKELKVYNNQIVLLAGVRRGMFIENHLIKSVDGGKNWVEEKLYKPTYASPIAFYGNNENSVKTWIYSGSGTIQVVE